MRFISEKFINNLKIKHLEFAIREADKTIESYENSLKECRAKGRCSRDYEGYIKFQKEHKKILYKKIKKIRSQG